MQTTPESPFWVEAQPGFRFTSETPGTPEFFAAVREHRYKLEPHIEEMARFEAWADRDVLDMGCGIATDGSRFALRGARYVGRDGSTTAVELARLRLELEGLAGSVVHGDAR